MEVCHHLFRNGVTVVDDTADASQVEALPDRIHGSHRNDGFCSMEQQDK